MVTPLDRPVRRAVTIGDVPYVVTISSDGLKLVQKGHRKGVEVSWRDVLEGEPTLRAQLQKSLNDSGDAQAAADAEPELAERQPHGAPSASTKRAH